MNLTEKLGERKMDKEKLLEMLECAKINCNSLRSSGLSLLPIVEAQIDECMNIANEGSNVNNQQIKEDIEFLKSKYGKEKSLKIPTTIMRVVGFAEKYLEDCK